MATYQLHLAERLPSLRKRVRDSFIFTVLWLLGFSVLERIAHGRWDLSAPLIVGGAILFLGGILTSFLWPAKAHTFDLEIDDFGMRVFGDGELLRKIRTGSVRYVRERRSIWGTTLIISEHSSFAKRFGKCVKLPRRLLSQEQYEQIKAQALGWLENSKT
jgi:hypothetical protein